LACSSGIKLDGIQSHHPHIQTPFQAACSCGDVLSGALLLLLGAPFDSLQIGWDKIKLHKNALSVKAIQLAVRTGGLVPLRLLFPEVWTIVKLRQNDKMFKQDSKISELQLIKHLEVVKDKKNGNTIWFYQKNPGIWVPDPSTDVIEENYILRGTNFTILSDSKVIQYDLTAVPDMKRTNAYSKGVKSIVRLDNVLYDNMMSSLTFLLQKYQRLTGPLDEHINKWYEEDSNMKYHRSPLYAVTQIFCLNVTIFYTIPGRDNLSYTFNVYETSGYIPHIYLIYDNDKIYPAIDPFLLTFSSKLLKSDQEVSGVELIKAIESSVTIEEWNGLLESFDRALVNENWNINGRHRTILYAACRSGLFHYVYTLSRIPNIKLDGIQDIFSGSSPLHVSSWYGFEDIIDDFNW